MYSTYTTELDALTNGGGSLDPMGLYAIADRLATIMVPGVRERMSNLRYLTAAAVGADLCREINPQLGWQSGTQPYMAFEWHVVQGLDFQFQKDQEAIAGMPGIQKGSRMFRPRPSIERLPVLEDCGGIWFSWSLPHLGPEPGHR